jgi:hypothetical protein
MKEHLISALVEAVTPHHRFFELGDSSATSTLPIELKSLGVFTLEAIVEALADSQERK